MEWKSEEFVWIFLLAVTFTLPFLNDAQAPLIIYPSDTSRQSSITTEKNNKALMNIRNLLESFSESNERRRTHERRLGTVRNNGKSPWRPKNQFNANPTVQSNIFKNLPKTKKEPKPKRAWDTIIVLGIVAVICAIISIGICILTKRSKQMAQANREIQEISRSRRLTQNPNYPFTLYRASTAENRDRNPIAHRYPPETFQALPQAEGNSSVHATLSSRLRYNSSTRDHFSRANRSHSETAARAGRSASFDSRRRRNRSSEVPFALSPPSYGEVLRDVKLPPREETPPPSYEHCVLLEQFKGTNQPMELGVRNRDLNGSRHSMIVSDV